MNEGVLLRDGDDSDYMFRLIVIESDGAGYREENSWNLD